NLMLSTRAIRTIDKLGGITPAIFAATEKLLSERLQKVRRQIYSSRKKKTAAGKTLEAKAAKPKHVRAEKPSGTPKVKAAKAAKPKTKK
ncbi:MAG: hypothetical protein ACXVC0_17295, partial [Bdellovibrionota bacterium]